LILFQVAMPGEAIRGLTGRVLVSAEEVTRAQVKRIASSLEQVRQTWLGDSPKVWCETATGDPVEQILATAERDKVDLIVMASHGHGAIDRLLIGSVSDRVVRTSRIPVMVIRPRDEAFLGKPAQEIRRIVVPFDGSNLASQALPFARRLALSLQAPVVLVKVTEIGQSFDTALSYGVATGPEIYDEILRDAQVDDRAEIARVADQLRRAGVEVLELVLDGAVADAIVRVTEPTDIIVMTSHGRGGFRRLVLGSIAEKLIRQGPVPIILVPATVGEEPPESTPEGVMKQNPVLAGHLI
jgi:nucleotide-binding universal stress UspA family protein